MNVPVVVTGIGAVTPLGVGADALHRHAVLGDSGILEGLGLCECFEPGAFFSRREIHRTDRFTQLAMAAAAEALDQAGWTTELPCGPERISCVVGSGVGGIGTFEDQLRKLGEGGEDDVSPLMVPMMMANAGAAQIAIRYGLRGQSYCIISACSAGAQALGAGVRAIRSGEADAAVVGGSESATSPIVQAAFRNAGALSPTGVSVPFDTRRNGFILAEGAGVLVMERADLAERRGAPILAEVRGYGASTDAYHITAPEPTGTAAAEAVRRALDDAATAPEEIGYINAHGTGTTLNDHAETVALRQALGPGLDTVAISSSKSYIGHTLGAAGAVEAVATVQALRHRTAPPTVGLESPDPALGELSHVVRARPLRPDEVALSTSFGFGGHNAALIFGARLRGSS